MGIEHVGYAVRDLEAAAAQFALLGFERSGAAVEDTGRGVRILFMHGREGGEIELIAPLEGRPSPVGQWLSKNGPSPYHVCCSAPDIERAVEELRGRGFVVVERPSPAAAMGGRRVAFLYGRDVGLVELAE
ncbi:MAG: VOC family protein [Synergistaceae bacterium]|jgi:methylmalonyl-CoA/ethylmalonyl-CoA epimerase|nr:VOC family protein [Synergistaceae bacterium]